MQFVRLSRVLLAFSIWVTTDSAPSAQATEISSAAIGFGMRTRHNGEVKPRIQLRVYDSAKINPGVMATAIEVTTEILGRAGMSTIWLDCPIAKSDCGDEVERPQFRFLIPTIAIIRNIVSDDSLGFAVPCAQNEDPCLFYVFYERINAVATRHNVSAGRILGHVMAHEIGHTLLGPNAHNLYGIMQPRLSFGDMERVLYFTSAQSKRVRTELLSRRRTRSGYESN